MPRNSTGTYTLPEAAFVAGTIIKSSEVNSNFNDIAFALTTSLATTGVSTMTGPVNLYDGTQTAPGLVFSTEPDTGWRRSAADTWVWSVNGNTDVITLSPNGLDIVGAFTATGNASVGGTMTVVGDLSVGGSLNFNNAAVSYLTLIGSAIPSATSVSRLNLGNVTINLGTVVSRPFVYDSAGNRSLLWYTGGQCRLVLDTPNLRLNPYMGNQLSIYASPREIPSTGVSLPASNTAATFVYIYAFMNVNTMALEMSTTGYVDQAESGVKVKSTDNTRTLVGAAYTDAAGAWADTDGKLWVLSYFNRKIKKSRVVGSLGVIVVATTTVTTEISTSFRNNFITWSDEVSKGITQYSTFSGAASGFSYCTQRIDNNVHSFNNWNLIPSQASYAPVNLFMNITGVTENTTHFLTPTVVSSAANMQVTATLAIAGSTYNTMYTMVEVMG